MRPSQPPEFLNVDLEIESRSKLDPLAQAMAGSVRVLYSGPRNGPGKRGLFLLCLESARQARTPDATIGALCDALDGLSGHGRRLWKAALRKEFDVGLEFPRGARSSHFSLRPATLRRIAALGATLAVTYYATRDDESTGCTLRRPLTADGA